MGAATRELFSAELRAEAASIPRARHEAAVIAGDFGADPFAVAVAVSEAVTNAVVHAYREGDQGSIRLDAAGEGSRLCIRVVDDGVGMSPNPGRRGLGMGLAIIGAMTSGFEVEDAQPGVRIRMYFERRPATASA